MSSESSSEEVLVSMAGIEQGVKKDEEKDETEENEKESEENKDEEDTEENGEKTEGNEEAEQAADGKFLFEGRNPKLIKAKLTMISGCLDQQCSVGLRLADKFKITTPAGLAGGALTSVLLEVFQNHKNKPDEEKPTILDLMKEVRTLMATKAVSTQLPQFSSSVIVDLNETFHFVPTTCTGVRRAVVIGINYIGKPGQLIGCHNDAINIKNLLIDEQGFEEKNVAMLMDDGKETSPNKFNIMLALHEMTKASEAGDFCFVHYSGHGVCVEDTDGDEKDGFDEAICALGGFPGIITDDELFETVVVNLQEGVTMFGIFDCCMSGTVMDLPYRYQFAEDDERNIEDVREEKGEEEGGNEDVCEEEEEEEEIEANKDDLDDEILAMTVMLMMMQIDRKMSKTKVVKMKKRMNDMMMFLGGGVDDGEE